MASGEAGRATTTQGDTMIEWLHNAGVRPEWAYLAGFTSIGLSFAA
jgi:hypothetical protein